MVMRRWYALAVVLVALGLISCGGGGGSASMGSRTGFGGAQDAGYFRLILANGGVPQEDDITYEGFLAEHDFPLPPPTCSDLLCMHGVVALGPAVQAGHRTILQLGLNSPYDPSHFTPAFRNLALVIDKSGSMSGRNIQHAREGLLNLVDQLGPSDVVSLIVYDSTARVIHPASPLADPESLKTKIRGIQAGGSTNIYDGMMLGYQEAEKHLDPQAANRVILLTDGMANTGVTDPAQFVLQARAYAEKGISISTIGVGLYYNQDLMLDLARISGGNNYFLDGPSRLQQVFVTEVQDLYTPIARDLHVEVAAGPVFRSMEAYGAGESALQPDGTLVIDVPSVFLSSDKQGALLVEMEVSGVGAAPQDLAEIRYQYVRCDNGLQEGGVVTPRVEEDVPYGSGAEQYDTLSTRKALVVLETVKGFKQACREYHDPQVGWQPAVATLQALEAFVLGHQAHLMDPEIDEDLDLMARFITNVTP